MTATVTYATDPGAVYAITFLIAAITVALVAASRPRR